MEFLHCDNNEKYITLHDCRSEKAYFENGILSFDFEDGFWILSDHPENNLSNTVRTDYSNVEFILDNEEDICVYVFEKHLFGITIRKEWKIDKLIDEINRGKCMIEFLYNYADYKLRIIECVLFYDKKPYFRECELKLSAQEVKYNWNKLQQDRVW